MENGIDINIELHFIKADAFSADLLVAAIEATAEAVRRAEEAEIEELRAVFADVPDTIFDAIRYRFAMLRARALSIRSARSGSIILFGIAAGLSYWLLDKTMGETVSEAWRESEMHERMKKLLHARIGKKTDMIAREIRIWPPDKAHVQVTKEQGKGNPTIKVTVVPTEASESAPSQAEVLERHRQRVKGKKPSTGGDKPS